MQKTAIGGLLLATAMLLAGCSVTGEEAHQSLVEEIQYRGHNPFIKAAEVKELEKRIQAISLAPDLYDDPFGVQFNPRNMAILDNFKDQYDHPGMMRDINLARQGFDAAVTAHYPRIGLATNCDLASRDGYFMNNDDQPHQFDWQFIQGDCEDGLVQGVARVTATKPAKADFVGRFDRGTMLEGVFTTTQPDGARIIQIGGVSFDGRVARLLSSKFNVNGYQWHRFGDFAANNKFDGFGINVWGYTNKMTVRAVGTFDNDELEGFAGKQELRTVGDGKFWATWLGMYSKGTLNGLGAWTNGISHIKVGQWQDGEMNGVGYGQFASYESDYHEFYAGRFEKGERQGAFQVLAQNSFGEGTKVEQYQNGNYIDDSEDDFDFGQLFAVAAGAAIIGGADIPDAAKVDIGTAFMADVMSDTGTTNMQSLQNTYQQQLQRNNNVPAVAGTAQQASATAKPAGGLKTYNAKITCEDTGVTNTIPVPYRTEACRIAAIDFAQTFACNKLDQDRVTRNCQSACGDPQCLQQ
ncbi:hypothetical protein [Thalassospira marina]|nr:hypothetical protein [Thalassospira marina]